MSAPVTEVERIHFWTAKFVKNGPLIGVKTFFGPPYVDGEFLDRGSRWQALLGAEVTARAILMGEPCPIEVDGCYLRNISPTTEANHSYLVAHAAYSMAHAPQNTDASPKEAVDFNKYTPF